ncbi:MAG: hypothetical protein Q9171_004096 [Xanthocarpia ochracea]
MRLFLLPVSTRRSLIYCQRLNNQLSSEITYADKITTRASNTWLRWERAERGWQKKITSYGNKLFEKIPHEEWGLKSIPPLSSRRKDEELEEKKQVEVVFPGSVIREEKVKAALQAFAGDKRQGFHTKWMWATRSGSQHVRFLLDNRLLKFTTSSKLDLAYEAGGLDVSVKELDSEIEEVLDKPTKATSEPDAKNNIEKMLLTPSNGRLVSELMDVPELDEQVQRAVKQVEKALRVEKEFQEEKQDLDKINKGAKARR